MKNKIDIKELAVGGCVVVHTAGYSMKKGEGGADLFWALIVKILHPWKNPDLELIFVPTESRIATLPYVPHYTKTDSANYYDLNKTTWWCHHHELPDVFKK